MFSFWCVLQKLKSLLVNNLTKVHSRNANCERDEAVGLLATLKQFITETEVPQDLHPLQENLLYVPADVVSSDIVEPLQLYVINYLAGYVVKDLFHIQTIVKPAQIMYYIKVFQSSNTV